jgi:hypothetical protein
MKSLLKNLLKKSTSKTYYDNIRDCNIWAWDKFKEHKNYAFLNPDNNRKTVKNIEEDYSEEGNKAFMSILSDYFQEFGVSDDYKNIVNLEVKLIKKNLEYCISGDRNILNEVNYYKNKIDLLNEKQIVETDSKRTIKERGIVATKLNRSFNDKEISILEYYSILNS